MSASLGVKAPDASTSFRLSTTRAIAFLSAIAAVLTLCLTLGAGAAIFSIVDAVLLTPGLEAGILPGITRAAVLELAHAYGVPIQEASIEPAIALASDEAFITNSVRGVVPVHAIGTWTFPVPGPLTARLARWYWELVEREAGASWVLPT